MSNFVKDLLKPATAFWDAIGIGKSNELRRALDPASVLGENLKQGKPLTARGLADPLGFTNKPVVTAPPGAPNQDTAANAVAQQNDQLRRRRGVYANIIGSSTQSSSSAPVATKTALGS